MNKTILAYLTIVIAFLSLGSSCLAGDSRAIASVTLIEGTARVQKPGSEGWLRADIGTELTEGEKVKANEDSRVELLLVNGAVIRMGPSTLTSIAERPGGKSDSIPAIEITVENGDVWGIAESIGESDIIVVSSPVSLGVAGKAVFRLSVGHDGTTEIKVYDGKVWAENKSISIENDESEGGIEPDSSLATESDGTSFQNWSVELEADHKLIVSSKSKIAYQGDFSSSDIDEITEWVEWNKSRDSIKE